MASSPRTPRPISPPPHILPPEGLPSENPSTPRTPSPRKSVDYRSPTSIITSLNPKQKSRLDRALSRPDGTIMSSTVATPRSLFGLEAEVLARIHHETEKLKVESCVQFAQQAEAAASQARLLYETECLDHQRKNEQLQMLINDLEDYHRHHMDSVAKVLLDHRTQLADQESAITSMTQAYAKSEAEHTLAMLKAELSEMLTFMPAAQAGERRMRNMLSTAASVLRSWALSGLAYGRHRRLSLRLDRLSLVDAINRIKHFRDVRKHLAAAKARADGFLVPYNDPSRTWGIKWHKTTCFVTRASAKRLLVTWCATSRLLNTRGRIYKKADNERTHWACKRFMHLAKARLGARSAIARQLERATALDGLFGRRSGRRAMNAWHTAAADRSHAIRLMAHSIELWRQSYVRRVHPMWSEWRKQASARRMRLDAVELAKDKAHATKMCKWRDLALARKAVSTELNAIVATFNPRSRTLGCAFDKMKAYRPRLMLAKEGESLFASNAFARAIDFWWIDTKERLRHRSLRRLGRGLELVWRMTHGMKVWDEYTRSEATRRRLQIAAIRWRRADDDRKVSKAWPRWKMLALARRQLINYLKEKEHAVWQRCDSAHLAVHEAELERTAELHASLEGERAAYKTLQAQVNEVMRLQEAREVALEMELTDARREAMTFATAARKREEIIQQMQVRHSFTPITPPVTSVSSAPRFDVEHESNEEAVGAARAAMGGAAMEVERLRAQLDGVQERAAKLSSRVERDGSPPPRAGGLNRIPLRRAVSSVV